MVCPVSGCLHTRLVTSNCAMETGQTDTAYFPNILHWVCAQNAGRVPKNDWQWSLRHEVTL
eukprot:253596-Amphidinium_carterae.1